MLNQRTKKTKPDPNHLVNPSKATFPNNNKLDCSPTTGKRLKDAVAKKVIKNVKDRCLVGDKTPQDKIDISQNSINYYVKFSFMITYNLLLTTATLKYIDAMRTKVPFIRHIINLETCISIIAGYFYSVFLAKIQTYEKENKPMDWADVTKTRYIDWSITTPLMLLALCVVLSLESNISVKLHTILQIVGLNYMMLIMGFLGEIGSIGRYTATFAGFVPFAIMFYIIYVNYIKPKSSFNKTFLYYFYLIIWGLYGVVYLLPDSIKNICMNILYCVAKCFIGNGLFIYYSNMIK
jgi:bacteriorhodopsin